MVPEKLILWSH